MQFIKNKLDFRQLIRMFLALQPAYYSLDQNISASPSHVNTDLSHRFEDMKLVFVVLSGRGSSWYIILLLYINMQNNGL